MFDPNNLTRMGNTKSIESEARVRGGKRQRRKEGLFIFGKVMEMHVMRLRYFVFMCVFF